MTIGLIINEIMASNIDGSMSPATNFDSWIELYNPTDASINLTGLWLSDDGENRLKWHIPAGTGLVAAHGYKVVWLGSNNIKSTQGNFKLNCDGGTIYLSDSDGELITSEDYPEAMSRVAYARTTDGGNEWGWTDDATPGKTNATAKFASERLAPPVVDTDSRVFQSSFQVHVDIPEGCTLRYTTNGALPTATSPINTTGTLTVSNTTAYRFRLFREGYLASVPVTRSYIKTSNKYTIPVISIVGDNRYFNDNTWGIAVQGTNGRTGNGQSQRCNWNMDWERPVNFSMMTPDGQMVFNQDVEISVSGGWSRAWSPTSFKLKSGKEFDGQNNLLYPFFPQKPYIRNKTLLLRNGGNDNWARFKDPAVQTILQRAEIDLDLQSYVPIIEYVNGQFKGVLNMREPNNRKFVAANFGYDDDRLDMFEMSADSNAYMMCGSAETLERIYDLATKAAQPDVYEELKQLLDIDEYINYMAAELYLGSTDWPHNNIKGYRYWDGGRYRFVLFDVDFVFQTSNPFTDFKNDQWHTFQYIYDLNETRHEEIKFVPLFINMLANDDFRRRFIDTYCIMGGSIFEKDRATAIINELADAVRPMMQLDGKNPDGSAQELRNGFNSRMTQMMTRMQQFSEMRLSSAKKYAVQLKANVPGARLFVNDTQVPYADFNGQLFQPVTLRAEAPGGYRFAGWKSGQTASRQIIATNASWKYYDRGALSGTTWRQSNYDDSTWKEAPAPLGYGMTGTTTTISYGSNANNKYPTYYFRHSLTLDQTPTSADQMVLNYQVDDGFIIYVNGQEAARYNMPSGTVSYNTFSTTYAEHTPLTGSITLKATLFQKGTNVIAVEVHNNNATSSDIFWTCELLTSLGVSDDSEYLSTESEMALPDVNNLQLTACFEPLSQEERNEQGMTPVRINEVSAANEMNVNEYWKRNDWVELVNTTDEDIDVEGMYLTDNINKPEKYQITKGEGTAQTVIPAHGHLIVWCDKLEPLTQLHTSFKLANEGGDVMLTAADGTWSDRLTYPAHKGDESVGRYPDGSNQVYQFSMPTIGKTNLMTMYSFSIDEGALQGIESAASLAAKDLYVRHVMGDLIVRCEGLSAPGQVSIYQLAGQMVTRQDFNLRDGYAAIPLTGLNRGCYIAKVVLKNGSTKTCKFLID